jgi:hypothetical protein
VDGEPCGVFAWAPPPGLVTGLSDLLAGSQVLAPDVLAPHVPAPDVLAPHVLAPEVLALRPERDATRR